MRKIANKKRGIDDREEGANYDSKKYKRSSDKPNIWDRSKENRVEFDEERNQVE